MEAGQLLPEPGISGRDCTWCSPMRHMVAEKEVSSALWLPLIGIVGGFLFSVIWEAQCRYVFPYYVFLILYVPMGLYEMGRVISRLTGYRKKTTEKDQTQEESLQEIA